MGTSGPQDFLADALEGLSSGPENRIDEDSVAEPLFDVEEEEAVSAPPSKQVLTPAGAVDDELLEPVVMTDDEVDYDNPLSSPAFLNTPKRKTDKKKQGRRGKPRPASLRKLAIPVLVGIGLALMAPGMWAVGILTGMDVPMLGRDNSHAMAIIMLVCWPISLLSFVSAIFMYMGMAEQEQRGIYRR
ncbi:MAG: hypothetical protein GC162_09660 [Planctomycetes bacterium]|nr:hypothetical protein [Planctomycetota bacterium]